MPNTTEVACGDMATLGRDTEKTWDLGPDSLASQELMLISSVSLSS